MYNTAFLFLLLMLLQVSPTSLPFAPSIQPPPLAFTLFSVSMGNACMHVCSLPNVFQAQLLPPL